MDQADQAGERGGSADPPDPPLATGLHKYISERLSQLAQEKLERSKCLFLKLLSNVHLASTTSMG